MSDHPSDDERPDTGPLSILPDGTPAPAGLSVSILEALPSGVLTLDAHYRAVFANGYARDLLGVTEAIRGQEVSRLGYGLVDESGRDVPPSDWPARRVLDGLPEIKDATYGIRRAGGDIRWCSVSVEPMLSEGGGVVLVKFLDITDRRRASIAVKRTNRLLLAIRAVQSRFIAHGDDPGFHDFLLDRLMSVAGARSGVLATVDAGAAEDAFAAIEVRARSGPQGAPLTGRLETALQLGEPTLGEDGMLSIPMRAARVPVGVLVLEPDGGAFAGELGQEIQPLVDVCAGVLAEQRTRRMASHLERQLSRVDRLAALGTMASAVAHETSNPLSYVLLNLEVLAEHAARLRDVSRAFAVRVDPVLLESVWAEAGMLDGFADPLWQMETVIAEVTEGARRVQGIIGELTSFAPEPSGETSWVDINACVRRALDVAGQEISRRARLETRFGSVPAMVGSDARLAQVFVSLLLHAARAMPDGQPDAHTLTVRTWRSGNHLCVEIRDTGPRIDERLSPAEAFEAYADRSFGGGLGLSIGRDVVRAHGGQIVLQSGRTGTSALVKVPVASREQLGAADVTRITGDVPRIAPRRRRGLVIEDDPLVRAALERAFQRDVELVTVGSVEDVRALLSRDRAFDWGLCDLCLGDGTAEDVLELVDARAPALRGRMVYVTAGAQTPEMERFVASLDRPVLNKPVPLDALRRAVAELIRGRDER